MPYHLFLGRRPKKKGTLHRLVKVWLQTVPNEKCKRQWQWQLILPKAFI